MKLAGKSSFAELHRWSVERARGVLGPAVGLRRGARRAGRAARWSTASACRARTGSPTRGSTSPRTCCAARDAATRSCSGARTSVKRRSSHARALRPVSRTRAGAAPRWASKPATASPATCPTCPRRSSRCSRRRASARSGRPARPTSACRACSTASARSSRRCCSPPTATTTTARRSTSLDKAAEIARAAADASSASWSFPTSAHRPTRAASARDRLPRARCAARRATIDFERLPFDHPLYILYSSGTTGVPKCIVHGAGGTLLQHLKEHRLHCDVKPGDRAVLLHHLRLDDVELAGLGARLGRDAAALRRLAVRRAAAACCSTTPTPSA